MTPKQTRFVQEYLIDLNATQAAIRAGYSAKNADVDGPRLLGNAGVKAAIETAQAAYAKNVGITVEYVLGRLKVESERMDDGASHSARVSALAHLGKHLGMFVDRVEQRTLIYDVSSEPLTDEEWEAQGKT